jgi:hypothetical protein
MNRLSKAFIKFKRNSMLTQEPLSNLLTLRTSATVQTVKKSKEKLSSEKSGMAR